jgi:hypothetical protein
MSETTPTPIVEGWIEIRFGSQTYRGNYLNDLDIKEQDINDELKKQPVRYVFWARMTAFAKVVYAKWKRELDKYSGQTYSFIRREMEARGEKFSERLLDSKVLLDVKYQELSDKVLRARLQLDHLTSIKDAFQQRKDLLMSLGANLRDEWDTNLAIHEKQLVERRLRDIAASPAREKPSEEGDSE